MPINLGFVLNIIDDLQEHLSSQDYITCMNTLRDANAVVKKHEEKICALWRVYYELRDENDFYVLLLDFIDMRNIPVPRTFDSDRHNLAMANEYLHGLNDSDDDHYKINDVVITYLHNLKKIKIKYERLLCSMYPELISTAADHIMRFSNYVEFTFCGQRFCSINEVDV